MGVLMNSFFSLPIYKRNYKQYYNGHEKYLEKQKIWFGNQCETPFNNLNTDLKNRMEQRWYWPPWKYNDIVGYLNIGMDGGKCLAADVYLRRKYFSRKHRWRHGDFSTLENQHILYAVEIEKILIDINNNDSYVKALYTIIERVKCIIKKSKRKYYLWIPSYSFECFDFVRAYKELKNIYL